MSYNLVMFTKLYFITLPILLVVDMIWLGLVAKGFYAEKIGYLMKSEISWLPAILFYIMFAVAIVFFVLVPNMSASWMKVLLTGAFLGLVAYGAYDLTNHATIREWPLAMTVVDMAWGAVLSGVTSLLAFLIAKKIGL